MSATLRQALYFAIALVYATLFLPPLWLFLRGIDPGMTYIDRTYPQPQSREPLYKNPLLIYTHIYSNILALGIQISLLYFHPPTCSIYLHGILSWTYAFLVVLGTSASVTYASKQGYGNDGGRAGFFAFSLMALATFYTLFMTLWYGYIKRDRVSHREWALRNFAVLYGNGVLFRVLANSFLVWMQSWGADFYASWCQMIYLSWAAPLLFVNIYLFWEREWGNKCLVERAKQEQGMNGGSNATTKAVL